MLTDGTFAISQSLYPPSGLRLNGSGMGHATLKVLSPGTLLNWTTASQVLCSNLTIDWNHLAIDGVRQDTGAAVHAISCDFMTFENMEVKNMAGFGSGFLLYTDSATDVHERSQLRGNRVTGDYHVFNSASHNLNGQLIEGGLAAYVTGGYVRGVSAFAHEFKHNTRYSIMSDCISYQSGFAFGYGQSKDPPEGVHHCVSSGLIAAACDNGFSLGHAHYNIVSALMMDASGRLGLYPGGGYGINLIAGGYNLLTGVLSSGNPIYPLRYRHNTANNAVQIAAMDRAVKIVTLDAGSRRNHTDILHPGDRDTILSAVDDASGFSRNGNQGNPITCHATREYYGSLSGHFHFQLAPSGGKRLPGQNFVFESDSHVIMALAGRGTPNDVAGLDINSATKRQAAYWRYVFGASPSADYWSLGIGGAPKWRFYQGRMQPTVDNETSLGTPALRLSNLYAVSISAGAAPLTMLSPVVDPVYTVAGLPDVAIHAGATVRVSDGSGHRPLVTSDGTVWRYADGVPTGAAAAGGTLQRVAISTGDSTVTGTTSRTLLKPALATIAAGVLDTAGRKLRIVVRGTATLTAGSSFQIDLGGAQIVSASLGVSLAADGGFELDVDIDIISASAQRVSGKLISNLAAVCVLTTSAALDLSTAQQVDISISPANAADTVTCNFAEVWLI